MFEVQCLLNKNAGKCEHKRCLFPKPCENLIFGHKAQIELLKKVLMGKPPAKLLTQFIEMFKKSSKNNQFLTYYFIAAYPGCTDREMKNL
jgi:hypothetical protein